MCQAFPAQIVGVAGRSASVEYGKNGQARQKAVWLPPGLEVRVGDWVLVYAGSAVSVIPEVEGEALLELSEEIKPG
jgi:hydrogenase assembly chaperone HypC/HupF